MSNGYITVRDLYGFAMTHKLLDARIRICDGMAVSYYPKIISTKHGVKYRPIIYYLCPTNVISRILP